MPAAHPSKVEASCCIFAVTPRGADPSTVAKDKVTTPFCSSRWRCLGRARRLILVRALSSLSISSPVISPAMFCQGFCRFRPSSPNSLFSNRIPDCRRCPPADLRDLSATLCQGSCQFLPSFPNSLFSSRFPDYRQHPPVALHDLSATLCQGFCQFLPNSLNSLFSILGLRFCLRLAGLSHWPGDSLC